MITICLFIWFIGAMFTFGAGLYLGLNFNPKEETPKYIQVIATFLLWPSLLGAIWARGIKE